MQETPEIKYISHVWDGENRVLENETIDQNFKIEYEKGENKTYQPQINNKRLCIFKFNIVKIIAPENTYITKLEFTNDKTSSYTYCNDDLIEGYNWIPQNPTPDVTITKKGDGGETAISYITGIKIYYYSEKTTIKAPEPKALYDESANTITIQAFNEDNNIIDNANFSYQLSTEDATPTELLNEYTEPISLLDYPNGLYHLWAMTQIDGYDNSDITYLGEFVVDNEDIPTIDYKKMSYKELVEGHWYIITSGDNKFALGLPDGFGLYSAVNLNMDVYKGTITVKQNQFDDMGILEFTYRNGNLIEKNTGKPLQDNNTVAQNTKTTQPKVTFETIDDSNHIIKINGQQLGFDGSTFGFSTNHNQSITLYTTGSDINTGIDNIVKNNSDINNTTTYYNLQGIRIQEPVTPGIYLKRQGKTTTKVLIH